MTKALTKCQRLEQEAGKDSRPALLNNKGDRGEKVQLENDNEVN